MHGRYSVGWVCKQGIDKSAPSQIPNAALYLVDGKFYILLNNSSVVCSIRLNANHFLPKSLSDAPI